jgi:Cys-rich protein (TIGR01571 family)
MGLPVLLSLLLLHQIHIAAERPEDDDAQSVSQENHTDGSLKAAAAAHAEFQRHHRHPRAKHNIHHMALAELDASLLRREAPPTDENLRHLVKSNSSHVVQEMPPAQASATQDSKQDVHGASSPVIPEDTTSPAPPTVEGNQQDVQDVKTQNSQKNETPADAEEQQLPGGEALSPTLTENELPVDGKPDQGPLADLVGDASHNATKDGYEVTQEMDDFVNDTEELERISYRLAHRLAIFYEGEGYRHLVVDVVVYLCAVFILAGLYIMYFRYREVPRDRDFQYGLLDCLGDSRVCLWGMFCPALRWADTVSHEKAGLLPFGAAFVFMFVLSSLVLCPLTFIFAWCWIVAVGVYYRQRIRAEYGLESETTASYIEDCCAWCCCAPCALIQEARQVDEQSDRIENDQRSGDSTPSEDRQLPGYTYIGTPEQEDGNEGESESKPHPHPLAATSAPARTRKHANKLDAGADVESPIQITHTHVGSFLADSTVADVQSQLIQKARKLQRKPTFEEDLHPPHKAAIADEGSSTDVGIRPIFEGDPVRAADHETY